MQDTSMDTSEEKKTTSQEKIGRGSSSYDSSDALHMRSIMPCFLAGCARLPQQFQWLLLQNLEVMIKQGIKNSTRDSS